MFIFILPVSGGGFVSQLAAIQHLSESEILPDLILGSSGGNVAAYISCAAQWKWASIEKIASELTSSLFAVKWNDIQALSFCIGYFKGNVYNKGHGVYNFLNNHFDSKEITKYEIWTGTYNKNRQKSRLFCNRKTSILNVDDINYDLVQTMDPIFADGNIELIARAGTASASIPAVVPSEIIFDEEYIDGGVSNASPLAILQDPILKKIKDSNDSMHLVYINSINLSSPNTQISFNVIDNCRQTARDLIRAQTVIDRMVAYGMLKNNGDQIDQIEFKCNYHNIGIIKNMILHVKYSLLEMYPCENYDVSLDTFTGKDVTNAMRESYQNTKCRLWWVTIPNFNYELFINKIE